MGKNHRKLQGTELSNPILLNMSSKKATNKYTIQTDKK